MRFSISSTCGLYCAGATALRDAMAGVSASRMGCADAGMWLRSPRGYLGFGVVEVGGGAAA